VAARCTTKEGAYREKQQLNTERESADVEYTFVDEILDHYSELGHRE
jgi:hypothetical protein